MSRNNAGLSTERIVAEALRIIDGQGLRRLTMRRLGDALGVEAMAVYHHFPLGKEQMFEAIVAHVTDTSDEAPAEPQEADSWQARLREWARLYRARLLRHAGALTLLIHRSPRAAAQRTRRLHSEAFAEAGLQGSEAVAAAAALESYVMGAVIHQVREQASAPAADEAADPVFDHRFDTGLRALLAGLTAGR